MIAKILVLVCAAFGLVSGGCIDVPIQQQSAQIISVPSSDCSQSVGFPVENVFSSGSSDFSQVLSLPVTSSGNVFSSGSSIALPVATSDNTLSDISAAGFSGVSSLAGATNGPESPQVQVFQAPGVTLPAVEGPVISLSNPPIPAPRVLSQKCVCTKTIVKPQVFQRTVTVPKIQRYIKRTVTPVVERYAYRSTPVSRPESSAVVVSGGSALGSSGLLASSGPVVVSSGSGSSGILSSSGSVVVPSDSVSSGFLASSGPVVVSGSGSFGCESQLSSVPVSVISSSSCPRVC